MSDGEYITDGPLIDLATPDWREDILPSEHILVKPNFLPDPEPSLSDSRRTEYFLSESLGTSRWNELDLDGLLLSLNQTPLSKTNFHN